MSEGGTEVVVTTPEPEAEPPTVVEDAPDVVVVDTGSNDSSGDDVELGVRIGHLEATVAMLEERLGAVQVTADVASDIAESAVDIAIDAAVEAEEVAEEVDETPEPEPDSEPGKKPWTHRGIGEWFGRGDN